MHREDFLDELNPFSDSPDEENEDDFLSASFDELNTASEIISNDASFETELSAQGISLISSEALADDLEIGENLMELPI